MKRLFITWIIVMILMVGGLTFIGWYNIRTNGTYFDLERTMRKAAERYFSEYTERLTGEAFVSKETLLYEGFIEEIDEDLVTCRGFVVATPRGRRHTFKSYIECEEYTTRGFDESRLDIAW